MSKGLGFIHKKGVLEAEVWAMLIEAGGTPVTLEFWRLGRLFFFFGSSRSSLLRVDFFLVARELSCPMTYRILFLWSGIEPVSPALEGGFLTIGPPGKPLGRLFNLAIKPPSPKVSKRHLWVLKDVLQGQGTEGKGPVPRSQMGQCCQGCWAAPLIGVWPGQRTGGSRSADILQWIPSRMRYSNIPLLISICQNLVFNNLSLGLNSISQKTECVCGGARCGAGDVFFCCCFAFHFLVEPWGLWGLSSPTRYWTSAQGLNLGTWQREHGVLSTGLPGNSGRLVLFHSF